MDYMSKPFSNILFLMILDVTKIIIIVKLNLGFESDLVLNPK